MSDTTTTTNDAAEPTEPKTLFEAPKVKTNDDQITINRLKLLYDSARGYRKPIIQQWRRNYNIMRNKTWGSSRPEWLPSPEVAEIYPRLASRVGWMTDQRPELQVVPAVQPNSPLYDFYSQIGLDLQTVLQGIWEVYAFRYQIEQVLWDGDSYGIGFFKTTWDPTLEGGQGNPIMRRVDPFTMYIDPQATSFEDANYIMEVRNVSLQELDRRFPGSAELLGSSSYTESVDEQPTRFSDRHDSVPRANPGPISPNTSQRYGMPGQSGRFMLSSATIADRGITLYECWIREHELTDVDDDGDKEVYDSWRVIVYATAQSGGYVLMDEAVEDIFGFNRHPYSRYTPINTGEFYGHSLIEMLTPSQLAVNRLLTALQMNVEMTGNPILLETARAQLSRTKIMNRPGQRIMSKDPNGGVSWMEPPTPSQMFMDLIQFHLSQMDMISGITAMLQGDPPPGRNSSDSLDTIQESGFVRVRQCLRNLEFALREQAQLQAELITQFYDTPRMVSAVGPTGQNTSIALKARHFYVAPQNNPNAKDMEPLKFNIMIDIGSENATSATAKRQDAAMLFAMGAYDVPAVLEAFNVPNRAEITQRIQQAMAAGAFQPPGARQRAQRKS